MIELRDLAAEDVDRLYRWRQEPEVDLWLFDQPPGRFEAHKAWFDAFMADFDVLLTPSAPGEAPAGLGWTGDPIFNAAWTALHVPCITVPAGVGPAGLPPVPNHLS